MMKCANLASIQRKVHSGDVMNKVIESYRVKNWARIVERVAMQETLKKDHQEKDASAEVLEMCFASAEELMHLGKADCTVLMDHKPMLKLSEILAGFPFVEVWMMQPTAYAVTLCFDYSPDPTQADPPNDSIPKALFHELSKQKRGGKLFLGTRVTFAGQRHLLARIYENERDRHGTLVFLDADCVEMDVNPFG